MQIAIEFVRSLDAPESLDNRKSFYFDNVLEIIVKDGEFKNHHVTIISDEPPRITYHPKPHCVGVRKAEDEDLKNHCIRNGNTYTFPYVQKNCVRFGKSWF